MIKKISLDCDGVIADVGTVLQRDYYNYFGREIPHDLINACYRDQLKSYAERVGEDYSKISRFLEGHFRSLFQNLSNLEIIPGVLEGIRELKKKGIDILVNSYRPTTYNGLNQNTKEITKNWFKRNGLEIKINTAETKEDKKNLICNPSILAHVDDNPIILKDLKLLHPNPDFLPIFFDQYNLSLEGNYDGITAEDSWENLTEFLLNKFSDRY